MLLDESLLEAADVVGETTAPPVMDLLALHDTTGDEPNIDDVVAIDESLVSRIERIVRCRTGCRIRDLRIDLAGNQVTISGLASTYYAKQLATHAALDEIPGCSLTNAIRVQ